MIIAHRPLFVKGVFQFFSIFLGKYIAFDCHSTSSDLYCRLSLMPGFPFGSLFRFPHPPVPLPRWGRGRIIIYFCKGLPPLASLCCLQDMTDSGKGRCARGLLRGDCRPDAVPLCRSWATRRTKMDSGRREMSRFIYFCRGLRKRCPALYADRY